MREALFSALGDLQGARVLDLYAGTGALGIEAISRGAASALFIENARPALAALRENLEALGLGSEIARVLAMPVARAVVEIARAAPFDLVLADPPYADTERALEDLEAPLAAAIPVGGRFVIEHASRASPPEMSGFNRGAPRAYGDTAVTVYLRAA